MTSNLRNSEAVALDVKVMGDGLLIHAFGARSKFWGVAGSEDFTSATLPTTPLDFQSKI